MSNKLHGKVALITGTSSGIGRACAQALAGEGAQIVLTARRRDRLEKLKAEVEALGGQAVIVTGDAREESTAIKAVKAATSAFGRLDILINNTGMGNYKKLVDTSAKEYDEMVDTNVRSTFLFSRHAVPVMIKQKSGTILMMASMAGVYGFAGEAVYCMTKFAQVGFAQALDRELREHGIKVGAICPAGSKRNLPSARGGPKRGWSNRGCWKRRTLPRWRCWLAHSRPTRESSRCRCAPWQRRWQDKPQIDPDERR